MDLGLRRHPESRCSRISESGNSKSDSIARHVELTACQIHVDRYKFSIYHHISDPFLRAITTKDPSSTRFHACERFHRCEYVAVDNDDGSGGSYSNCTSHMGKRVVYVNPVTLGTASWDLYLQDTKDRLIRGETINNLVCQWTLALDADLRVSSDCEFTACAPIQTLAPSRTAGLRISFQASQSGTKHA
jgi:hypothetical protein